MKRLLISFGFALALAPSFAFAQVTSGPPWGGNVPAPSAPQNLQYECNMLTGDQVRLWWSPAANATNYGIRVNIPGHADFVHVVDNHPQTSITLPITPNQEYAWWVHANNAANPLGPYTIGPRFTCHPNPSQAPTFSASPTSGAAPLTVTFKFSGTGNTYRVDFGDGASQDLHPECYTGGGCEFPHTYASVGTYTASLRTLAGVSVASVSISVTSPLTSQPSITLIAPTQGQNVAKGSTFAISWTTQNAPAGAKVYIQRSNSDLNATRIGTFSATGQNSFDYTFPLNFDAPQARIRAVLANEAETQTLATTFVDVKVVPAGGGGGGQPSITIIAPQAGASVLKGSVQTVSWSVANAPQGSMVRIRAAAPANYPIAENLNPQAGTYQWTVGLPVHSYQLYVQLMSGNSIIATQNIPITVTAPNDNPPPAGGFAIGGRVRATSNVNVRAMPSTSGANLGMQSAGMEGTITDGPQSGNGYTWWKINWDSGPDGWSVQNYIDKLPQFNPQTTAFFRGEHVQAARRLNVRSTPSITGVFLGQQDGDARGIISGGPQSANGYTWWKVDWRERPDGWSIQDALRSPVQVAALAQEKANTAVQHANDSAIIANNLTILPGTLATVIPELQSAITVAKDAAAQAIKYAKSATDLAEEAREKADLVIQLASTGHLKETGAASNQAFNRAEVSLRFSEVVEQYVNSINLVKQLLNGSVL